MSVETTQLIFAIILAIAIFVWAWSVRRTARLMTPAATSEDPWAPAFSMSPTVNTGADVVGIQTVKGTANQVSRLIALQFLKNFVPGHFASPFEVVEQTNQRVVVRKSGPLVCNQPSGMYFSEAEFEIKPMSLDSVEVHYRIGFERLRIKLQRIALGLILLLGLPVLIIVPTIIWVFVVNNPQAAIRWQVFQTLQVLHVLWPPFLVTSFLGSGQRHARTFVSNLLRTVELLSESTVDARA